MYSYLLYPLRTPLSNFGCTVSSLKTKKLFGSFLTKKRPCLRGIVKSFPTAFSTGSSAFARSSTVRTCTVHFFPYIFFVCLYSSMWIDEASISEHIACNAVKVRVRYMYQITNLFLRIHPKKYFPASDWIPCVTMPRATDLPKHSWQEKSNFSDLLYSTVWLYRYSTVCVWVHNRVSCLYTSNKKTLFGPDGFFAQLK